MSRPPALFDSLPSELLGLIASHLDQPSILTFSLISKRCASAAQTLLWRDIQLTTKVCDTEVLKRRYKAMLQRGDARKWEAVRKIKASTAPSALYFLFQLLEKSGDNLISLKLLSAAPHRGRDFVIPESDDFTLRVFNFGPGSLSFPNLIRLRLVNITHVVEFLPYIISCAPQLKSLDVEFDNSGWQSDAGVLLQDTEIPQVPRRVLALRSIRFAYRSGDLNWGTELRTRQIFRDILKDSPQLRQLSVLYRRVFPLNHAAAVLNPVVGGVQADELLEGVSQHENLTDLRLRMSWKMMMKWGTPPGFAKLRRLLVDCSWTSRTDELPTLPSLATILFDCTKLSPIVTPMPALPIPSSPLDTSIDANLAGWLRGNPKLHKVHFSANISFSDKMAVFTNLDKLESSGNPTIVVRSIRHESHEVLRISVRVDNALVTNDTTLRGRIESQRLIHIDGDVYGGGTVIQSTMVQELTDWEGSSVPLEVMEKMRVVEGASEAAWNKRGVEVGNEAWQVLLNWRAGMTA